MIDENTDLAVNQNILVFITFVFNGKPETHFLDIKRVRKADAERLFETVHNVLKEKGLCLKNLVGIATDGALIMIGHKSSVVTRLKKRFLT